MGFIPISPATNKDGQLEALVRLLEKDGQSDLERAKPEPLTNLDVATLSNYTEKLFSTSVRSALDLGVMGVFDGSMSVFHDVLVHDICYGIRKLYGSAPKRLICGAYWGSALRLTLRTTVLDVKMEFSLGGIAAAAQLGHMNVEYELSLVGDVAASSEFFAATLESIPLMGTFDYEAYATFKAKQDALRDMLIDAAPARPTKVIAVDLQYQLPGTTIDESLYWRYAMNKIVHRVGLDDALKLAPSTFSADTIRKAYAAVVGKATTVEQGHVDQARKWIYA